MRLDEPYCLRPIISVLEREDREVLARRKGTKEEIWFFHPQCPNISTYWVHERLVYMALLDPSRVELV